MNKSREDLARYRLTKASFREEADYSDFVTISSEEAEHELENAKKNLLRKLRIN